MTDRMEWIFTKPCGCPVGVMEGAEAEYPEEAMHEMYGYGSDLSKARERGISVRLITFAEYDAQYFQKMLGNPACDHEVGR